MSNGALTQLVAIGSQESNFLSTESKDSVFVEPTKKINNFVKSTISMQPLGSSNFGSTTKFKIEKKYRITFFSQKHVLSDETSSFHFFFIFRSAKNFEKT